MGVIFRQSFKSTIATYIGVLLGVVNMIFLMPKLLTPTEIGLRDILVNTSIGFAYISQLGIAASLVRHFPLYEDEERQNNGVVLLTFLVSIIGFGLFVGLFIGFKDQILSLYLENSPEVASYYYHFIPLTLFFSINVLFETIGRLRLRITVPALVREIVPRALLTLLIIAYGVKFISFPQLINLLILGYFFMAVLLFWYLKKFNILYFNFKYLSKNMTLNWSFLKNGLWLVLVSAGSIVIDKIDGWMLASYIGLASSGIYSISFFIGNVIEMPRRALSMIAGPMIADYWSKNDLPEINKLYKKSALNSLLIGGLFFILIWINLDALFFLMPNGEIFMAGKSIVLFIGLARVIDMGFGMNDEIIINSKYYRFNLMATVVLGISSFGLNAYLIPRYGLDGAAIGTFLALLIHNLMKLIFLYKYFNFSPASRPLLIALVFVLLLFGLGSLLNYQSDSIGLTIAWAAFKSLLVMLAFGLTVWKLNLSSDMSAQIQSGWEKVLRIGRK